MINKKEPFNELLEFFDYSKKNNFYEKRIVSKSLYEYYQRVLLAVGLHLCSLNKESLRICHLKTLWNMIKPCLSYIDPNLRKWEELIYNINGIRSRIEHNLEYEPPLENLKDIRKEAPKFRDWILDVAKKYYKESKNFTFKEAFKNNLSFYIQEVELLIHEFGENLKTQNPFEKEEYENLPSLIKRLKKKEKEISNLDDISSDDLTDLITLVKIINKFRGKEEVLLSQSICPQCGGKIKETQKETGGRYDEPPTAVHLRVGCEKCDYTLHTETIDI